MKRFSYFVLLLLSCYVAYALLTAPSASLIAECPQTYVHKIRLCKDNSNYISLDEVASITTQAILISEDKNFFQHKGFDFSEMLASLKKDLLHLRFVRGGSTISQQVVKNLFFSGDKSLQRKIQEAYLTIKLENSLSKQQILEKYLNLIELGPNVYGIKQAAAFYFHKQPADLSLLESAYLAHLLPNPRDYSHRFAQHKLTRFNRFRVLSICRELWHFGLITAEQYLDAEKEMDDFPWDNTRD